MRFLLDECLPGRLAEMLRAAGHDCSHVYDAGLRGQPDEQIMALAERERRILISADTDHTVLNAFNRTRGRDTGNPASAGPRLTLGQRPPRHVARSARARNSSRSSAGCAEPWLARP